MRGKRPAEPLEFVLKIIKSQGLFGRPSSISTAGMTAARERKEDFASDLEMQLTGIGVDPITRAYADSLLDEYWADNRPSLLARVTGEDQRTEREVIIGSGFHAATYASIRVAAGHPRPIVVDQAKRAGGIFAVTDRPMFYLNSSNRPGGPGFVRDFGAQPNYLPGAPVQPSNLSAAEFETNAEMAWVIRMALAQNAEVITDFKINKYNSGPFSERPYLYGPDGQAILVARVIDARGLGQPKDQGSANGTTVLTFPQFMQRLNQPWPLRGIRRVAVIGNGDAARVSIEQLIGVGPQMNLSMANDRVDLIDWYGENIPKTPADWRNESRTRYLPIAKFLSDGKIGTRKIRVFGRRANAVALPDQALVQGRSYDLVVLATGWKETFGVPPSGLRTASSMSIFEVGDVVAARYLEDDQRIFRIGPHARLDFSRQENADDLGQETNRISMSRLGPKTAALAATLPDPQPVGTRFSAKVA